MTVALVTNVITGYRAPLYERLAERHDIEVLCHGGGRRYVPSWFADLDRQIEAARFPARRIDGSREAFSLGRDHDAVIAPFTGGPMLLATYAGARRHGRPFILWASVWSQPRSVEHLLTLPAVRRIYRDADAVVAYGEHVRRFVAHVRGRDSDVFVAPQAVEERFRRDVPGAEVDAFRDRHGLSGRLVLYVGRITSEKGVPVLLDAWRRVGADATLVVIGEGPFAEQVAATPRARLLAPVPRDQLPAAYAAAELAVLPSIATPRFREPWGLVCNEAMHQGRPVVVTRAVGAAAGGLVRDGETGLVVESGDSSALQAALDRLLSDGGLRARLGGAAKAAVAPYSYAAMVTAFDDALAVALDRRGTLSPRPPRIPPPPSPS